MKKILVFNLAMALISLSIGCKDKEENNQKPKKEQPATTIVEVDTISCPEEDFYGCIKTKAGEIVALNCTGTTIYNQTICQTDQTCIVETDETYNTAVAACVHEMPAAVKATCNDKTGSEYLCTEQDGISWVVFCNEGMAMAGSSENCSARNLTCSIVENNGFKVGECLCSKNSQCTTNIANASPVCTEDKSCSFECNNGYHKALNNGVDSCEKDTEYPEAVSAACISKDDDTTACVTIGNDVWAVYCEGGAPDEDYTEKCGATKPQCGAMVSGEETYYDCLECLVASDCSALYQDEFTTYECVNGGCYVADGSSDE